MTEQSTALAVQGTTNLLANPAAFEHTWRVAKAFSMSQMVPPHFQGKPENCMVALMMAEQLEINHLLALQNLTVIQGRPGFNAQFAIALANRRGPFRGPISWTSKGQGDSLEVTAKAVLKENDKTVSVSVSMEIAKAEGWTKNPKYRTMPEQMLRYRSATWLIRLYCPEVLLGFGTSEEIEDTAKRSSHNVERVTVTEPETNQSLVKELNAELQSATKRKQPARKTEPEAVEDAVVVPVEEATPLVASQPESAQVLGNETVDDPF